MRVNVTWLLTLFTALRAKSFDSVYAVRAHTIILIHVIKSMFKDTSVLRDATYPTINGGTILNAGCDLTINHHISTIREP